MYFYGLSHLDVVKRDQNCSGCCTGLYELFWNSQYSENKSVKFTIIGHDILKEKLLYLA